jgi:hypothetical protein
MLFGIALSILCVGIGCGDFTLFGDDDQGVCDPDPCASKANATAGTCTDLGGDDYSCGCKSGYFWKDEGNTCEDPCDPEPCKDIDYAEPDSCKAQDFDNFTCRCDSGYVWDADTGGCEDDPCNGDPCASIDHAQKDSCEAQGAEDYTCRCDSGYVWNGDTGSCQDDPCDPDPCRIIDNAEEDSCTGENFDDFACDCDTGFTWNAQEQSCDAGAVGTCDDRKNCLLDCNWTDFACQGACQALWTGCECDLYNPPVECPIGCLSQVSDPLSQAYYECVVECVFDGDCL